MFAKLYAFPDLNIGPFFFAARQMTASATTSMVNKARDTAATRSPAVTAAATDLATNTAAVAAAVPATNSTEDTTRTVTTLTTTVLSQPATTRTA